MSYKNLHKYRLYSCRTSWQNDLFAVYGGRHWAPPWTYNSEQAAALIDTKIQTQIQIRIHRAMQQDSIQKQQLIPNNVKYYLFLTEVISDVVGVVVDDYNAGPAILSLSFHLPLSLRRFAVRSVSCCSCFKLMCSCFCCCGCFSAVELELSPNYATQRWTLSVVLWAQCRHRHRPRPRPDQTL